jgi:hypothetical protein
MATSNTVSSVPTIQSIISRIGAPVILTIKLDRFVEEAGVSWSDGAGFVGFNLANHATGNGTNSPVPGTA